MVTKTNPIIVSVEDGGNSIQIANTGILKSSCKITFKPEQVDNLNQWLVEAKSKALEMRESAMNMVNEGGPA